MVINLAVHDNFNSSLVYENFTTVLTGKGIGLDAWVYAEDPGFCTNDFLNLPQTPSQVQLVSPLNNSNITGTSVKFIWNRVVPDVINYWLETSDSSDFASPKIDSSITDTSATHLFAPTGGEYWWRVKAKNNAGWGEFSEVWKFNSVTTDVENVVLPTEYALFQNYPNPFNPSTTICYHIPTAGFVTLKIYDFLGSEYAVLVNEQKSPGYYEIKLDGSELSTGIYFYELRCGQFSQIKKLILLK